MSDRLNELRRQRALVQQHLEWLDAEIAAAANRSRSIAPIPAATTHGSGVAASPIESISLSDAPPAADFEALVAAQKSAPAQSAAEVKRGCFIAFALVFVALGLAVYGWYLYSKSQH